jgi:hypothetical protein
MDSRSGQPHIPGMTAQSKTFKAGGNPGEGLRLEWQVDNATTPGSWTYTYRLIRGTSKNKGFAFFDIETASDFTVANMLNRQVSWATDGTDSTIPSGLASVTISDPVTFNAVHDFSNAAVTEGNFSAVALGKNDLSHYSGDPARAAPGVAGADASDTTSVGPVAHPFYGIRVTFPGTHLNLAYEASEWEFRIVSDRAPMWGSFFGWGDQTQVSPFWYANIYNKNIDNAARLDLPPANNLYGAAPYNGWVLVPGPQAAAQPSRLSVDLATYYRSSGGDGYINIFATALPNAVLTLSGSGIAAPVVMSPDTPNPVVFGRFSARIPFTQLPSSIVISNSRDPVTVLPHTLSLADEVLISEAAYDPVTRIMTIRAASSDGLLPLPTLTVPDFAGPNSLDSTGTLLKTLTANPPDRITVTSSRGGSATAPVSIVVPVAVAPATGLALFSSVATPQVAGTAVVFNAAASGGTGSYEYRFWLKDTSGVYTLVQPFSAATTWNWDTTGLPPGAYTIAVQARSAGSTSPAGFDVESVTGFFIIADVGSNIPATAVNIAANPGSPQAAGTPVTFTGTASGGSGFYEYQFWLKDTTGVYTLVRPFSQSQDWTWDTTGASAGAYTVAVQARSIGTSPGGFNVENTIPFEIQ